MKDTKSRMKNILIIFLLFSFLIISCQEILFNDEESTRELSFENFNALEISGMYNIILIQDSANRLVITGENNIKSIDAVIKDDTLIIDDHKKMSFNPARNTLYIHFSNLKYMVTYDPVNVSNADTIKVKDFSYDAIGEIEEVKLIVDCSYFMVTSSANTLGYFYCYGKSYKCAFVNRYGCSIFADSLLCKNVEVTNESIGDVYVNASDYLEATIWGPGDIYYHGNPVIRIMERKGEGEIIRIN